MGYKRGFYLTKKKKKEFDFAYRKIKELNSYIINSEIEKEILIKNENWEEVIGHEKYIFELKLQLYEYGQKGYDISYGT